ncbi:helix-turn-helix domain-containing protein [Desulforamulus aeronauticus]|uniref:DNA binding domain-containing protein, excisionase family n=1 Tax=Desulforamulus aeronauticus DSM 10349 TaxID=1121421 RepID=A0A1M6SCD4_9FIRM|nr:helix-turn-helix domain-containing protein [Desulforamulus aeronauticus]SHK42365.1 DNA binding domain-containing protein, excisionase family [Desulforamulus aeronauticus DSM 10349]
MEIYTIPQLAKLLKRRKQDVYSMVYSGEIESFKTGVRGLRVTQKAVNEYISSKNTMNYFKI